MTDTPDSLADILTRLGASSFEVEAIKRLIAKDVSDFCAELLALDAGAGSHGKWPDRGIHSNGARLVALLEAIRKRRDA